MNYDENISYISLELDQGKVECKIDEREKGIYCEIDAVEIEKGKIFYLDDLSIENVFKEKLSTIGSERGFSHERVASIVGRNGEDNEHIIDDILWEEKTNEIFDLMNSMDIGELKKEGRATQYVSPKLRRPLDLRNDTSIATDVTRRVDRIYEVLGKPFLRASEELNAED